MVHKPKNTIDEMVFFVYAYVVFNNMDIQNNQQKREAFQHKTFVLMLRILFIFGIPAVSGYFLGKYLDTRFNMRPLGSVLTLVFTFILSWTLVIRMYLKLEKERKAIDQGEKDVEEKKQPE